MIKSPSRIHPSAAVTLSVFMIAAMCSIARAGEVGPLGEVQITVTVDAPEGAGKVKGGSFTPINPVQLQLTCTDPVAFSRRIHTDAYGQVTIGAPRGTCLLASTSPFRAGDKRYTWKGTVEFVPGELKKIALSSQNALAHEGQDSPSETTPPVPLAPATAEAVEPTVLNGGVVPPIQAKRASDGVVLPEPLFKVEPEYPVIARRARIEGKVIVQAVIDKEGGVHEVTVLDSSNPMFDASAIAAVEQRMYKPALQDGQPVRIYFTIRVDFRLR